MAEIAPKDLIYALRKPKVIFTKAFVDDPITFNTDERLLPDSLVRQTETISVVERDVANFAIVDTGVSGSVYYPSFMMSPTYKQEHVEKYIDTEFKEFV